MPSTQSIAHIRAPSRWSGLLAGLLLLLPVLAAAADTINAHFDQTEVYDGDTVTLVIELSGINGDVQPDVAPLADDFDVGGTGIATQTSIINGHRSDTTRLQISLRPKRVGTIEVPPLTVGDSHTPPLTLTVKPVPAGGASSAADELRVEVDLGAEPDALVVNQQVPLVVRAVSARPLLDYELQLPSIDGAVLTQLGREQGRIINRNGRQLRVIEWRFTLSPERSGELRIPPMVVDAEVQMPDDRRGASPFGNDRFGRLFDDPAFERLFEFGRGGISPFQRGMPRRARSASLTLDVAPQPKGFGGDHWLPAEDLGIEDEWAANPPTLAVGEPATRTLTLTAKGLAGNQIPQIDVPGAAGVKVYPETTESETRTDGSTVIGVSRQKVTLIPSSGGELKLPEVRVPWWDTRTQRERVAVVPALTVQVAGPVAAPVDAGPPAAAQATASASSAPADDAMPPAAEGETTPAGNSNAGGGLALWAGLLVAVLALSALAVALWQRRSARRPAPDAAPAPRPSRRDTSAQREALRQACERNDASAAAKALLAWAAARWPDDPPVNLAALAARAGGAGADAIQALERRLYAPTADVWDGNALWRAVQEGLDENDGRGTRARDDLPPLYPQRT